MKDATTTFRGVPVRNFKKVPRNRTKPDYTLLAMVFAISAVLSAVCSFAVYSPSLVVRRIDINGVHLANRGAVENAARRALGGSIVLLPKSRIAAAIRALPEVNRVAIGRDWPDRVWIRVTERRARAILTDCQSSCLMQRDGLLFHKTTGPTRGVPVVQVSGRRRLKPGDYASSADVCCALKALESARENSLPVGKISVDPQGDMCLNMRSDFYVKLGQPDEIDRKMSILRRALSYRPSIAREAVYIDVSCPSAPVWKPKASVGA